MTVIEYQEILKNKGKHPPRQDSNLQSPYPKSGPLSLNLQSPSNALSTALMGPVSQHHRLVLASAVHILKLERLECARMTRKIMKRSTFFALH